MLINCEAIRTLSRQSRCFLPTLDSKLADYQVNLVGQFARMQIEFAIAGSKCKRPAKFT
jgi:hypothetical protein